MAHESESSLGYASWPVGAAQAAESVCIDPASAGCSSDDWVEVPDEDDDPRFDSFGFRSFEAPAPPRPEASSPGKGGWARWSARQLSRRPLELKRLVRRGVPAARRSEVWPFLARIDTLRCVEAGDYYAVLRDAWGGAGAARAAADLGVARQIELDVSRTFPGHRVFGGAAGRQRLRSVLLAYSRRNPEVGYVQGMGFLAADCLLCEGVKGLQRVDLALLQISEARLLCCTEQHALLLVLQEEEGRCHDIGRLFALAFDTRLFIGPFPRSLLSELRTHHLAALASGAAPPAPGEPHDDGDAEPLTLAPPGACRPGAATNSGLGESSSDEAEERRPDPFEMLSLDDVAAPPRRQ
ncbi:hypothetical protein EMIHUDRAFT_631945 [Emiliania huxleyi CCMP1516]|uniref:Rab-GAP TBC domain-containing protein n=6 Tax=Emiliania huxleyi TaxID=2903 RepID=A0A0D3JKS0_EMIH1|nr:hypothetical protein EMIHUDRAFT_631945 [Emiliania huxleyi CCMP1516]EOD24105.1 hypothetical protein EMIHUDRAFT_631945 [Emiliania huxleyi CCMP1516]|eukprot:XP_005776534.1 hypothetical protein EMIHUDRAFT_631945 [Emiliania huxleyi CCMP1516]